MVASVSVFTDFGGAVDAPGTKQDIDALGPPRARFKDADNATIDLLNPIVIPGAGTVRSRWKHFYIKVDVAGAPDTQIDNLKIYGDGTGFGTGITMDTGDETPVNTLAGDGGYDPSDVSDELLTNHVDITAVTEFFTNFTSGAPKSVSISEAGSILDADNEESDYVVLQLLVANTASPGDLADEIITHEYDEI